MTPSAWVPLSSNRIFSASAPVRMSRFFFCKIGLRREEIFVSNKTCTVSDLHGFPDQDLGSKINADQCLSRFAVSLTV
jgi:hypothetical protein